MHTNNKEQITNHFFSSLFYSYHRFSTFFSSTTISMHKNNNFMNEKYMCHLYCIYHLYTPLL